MYVYIYIILMMDNKNTPYLLFILEVYGSIN